MRSSSFSLSICFALVAGLFVSLPATAKKRGKAPEAPPCAEDAKGDNNAEVPKVCVFKNLRDPIKGPLVITHFQSSKDVNIGPEGSKGVKVSSKTISGGSFYLPRGWVITGRGATMYAGYEPKNIKPPPPPPEPEKKEEAKKDDGKKDDGKKADGKKADGKKADGKKGGDRKGGDKKGGGKKGGGKKGGGKK